MSIRAAVRYHAMEDADIAEIVDERIYTSIVPQTVEPPYLLIQHIFGVPDQCMAGESGMEHAGVQFDAFATTEDEAADLIDKVRLAFDGLSTTIGDTDEDATIRVSRALMRTRRSFGPTPYRGDEFGLFRVMADFEFIYDITVATPNA